MKNFLLLFTMLFAFGIAKASMPVNNNHLPAIYHAYSSKQATNARLLLSDPFIEYSSGSYYDPSHPNGVTIPYNGNNSSGYWDQTDELGTHVYASWSIVGSTFYYECTIAPGTGQQLQIFTFHIVDYGSLNLDAWVADDENSTPDAITNNYYHTSGSFDLGSSQKDISMDIEAATDGPGGDDLFFIHPFIYYLHP